MAMPLTYVEVAPALQPTKYGLLDTVDVQPDARGVGVEYVPEFCGTAHTTVAACTEGPALGSISVSVADTGTATITGTDEPAGANYTINWGDGNTDGPGALDGQTNAYAAPGTYTVTVTGADGYTASVEVTVTEAQATGPFDSDAVFNKIATDGLDLIEGVPVVAYHLFRCRTVASWDDGEARAVRSLDLGASRAVEDGFWDGIASGATDVTPAGTATDIVVGLGVLEQYAGSVYGGRPVIHMSREQATRLIARSAVHVVGDHLETGLGSLVVAGAGYDPTVGPNAEAAGAGWMIATGQVVVWKGNESVVPASLEMPYTNEFSALAERPYTVTYECFHAAVEVTAAA